MSLVIWLFDYVRKKMKKQNCRQPAMRVNEAVAMATQSHMYVNVVNFDTDSHANRIEDFDGPVIKTDRLIKAFAGGRVSNVYSGTIVWKW